MLIITIKQGKEKSILAGDPWIYLSAIEKVDGKPQERNKPGATAIVQSSSRRFLARAAYNARSQIAARVWTLREDEPVDHALVKRRVQAAVERRAAALRDADPQALVRCAFHLGNRHGQVQIGADHLRIRADPVLREMLAGLGATVTEEQAAFHPEPGAYAAGHGHAHAHEARHLLAPVPLRQKIHRPGDLERA